MLSQSVENFLKAIYDLQKGDQWVATSALAERLKQKPASATNMVQRLARTEGQLVEYVPYQGVRLTDTGTKVALEIIRHHRLIELYLTQALGLPWDRVHDEAEKLEHVISEELEDRMAAALTDTRFDPHGSPIPTKDGHIKKNDAILLADVPVEASVRIVEVHDHDARLLRYLGDLGLYPGAAFTVIGREPFSHALQIQFGDRRLHLGEDALAHIWVTITISAVPVAGTPAQELP
ncbi:MAG: metal-dependent transcriptional regulator [Lentisphaerae bacterium]|nr:metal-dependent transcriptional regulator [Lentisphaerota bacterium]